MMMFRRLYWVAEQVDRNGHSKVTGVYTSIQDLMHKGLHWCDGTSAGFRLTLVKPDEFNAPIGTFQSPTFDGLREALDHLVVGSEYTTEEVFSLESALDHFLVAKV